MNSLASHLIQNQSVYFSLGDIADSTGSLLGLAYTATWCSLA